MNYYGVIIQRERLNKNWSQEGLCKGICSVSYLSKIEKGKASPSDEIIKLLFDRLGIQICKETQTKAKADMEKAYELLFTGCFEKLKELYEDIGNYSYTKYGIDYMLIDRILHSDLPPLDEKLEKCMNNRQLAVHRITQGKYEEAVKLFPNSYTYYAYGVSEYQKGNYTLSLELLQISYNSAATYGSAKIMLLSKAIIGNCYCNQLDYPNTVKHYDVAKRLAEAVNDTKIIQEINYNLAAMQIEQQKYEEAYDYLKTVDNQSFLTLHKLAICCEKTDRFDEALSALNKAEKMIKESYIDSNLALKMCNIVRYRLEHNDYLRHEEYGNLLISTLEEMRKQLPVGYASFHIPWILEWYQHSRQYKQAYELLLDFPGYYQ